MATEVREETASEVTPEVGTTGPATLNGAPARALVALSPHGKSQVAVWLVNFVGESCGAWLLDARTKEDAQTILRICDRRAVIEDDPSAAQLVLDHADKAGIEIPESQVKQRLARLDDLLSATAEARRAHHEAVAEYGKRQGKKLAPLTWRQDLPESVKTLRGGQYRGWAGEGEPPPAFGLLVLSRQLVRLWTETETTRMRRKYLREQFGPQAALPDEWRDAALSAYASPYTLA